MRAAGPGSKPHIVRELAGKRASIHPEVAAFLSKKWLLIRSGMGSPCVGEVWQPVVG